MEVRILAAVNENCAFSLFTTNTASILDENHTWPAVTVCGDGGGDKKNLDPYYSKKNYNVHEWATGGRWG